ncbi:CYTH and CHAD domain-containing protein [Blastococcus sp. MG754427]|uniref:CYTH and CHAD domain-containing protein n=2 Tax=unclassified Blastococcus TaxID=2619396 RepID=UPI001F21D3C5|nr:CYTH and CHAD domain-containing protein [Blastococcus sp. MG754427]MCF6514051.1 CYTH and CHAD domain-containing protein [Blastococcus sp. MG754427]
MPSVQPGAGTAFETDDAEELPPLLELVHAGGAADPASAVTEGGPVRQKLVATYFDTPDLRLTAAGVTVRRRRGGDDAGWQLLGAARGGARPEVTLPPGRGTRTVPARIRAMVRVHGGGAALVPVAEVTTERSLRRLVDATGAVLAEVADDRVAARRLPVDGREADDAGTAWREIRLVDGSAEVLGEIGAGLGERGLTAGPAASALHRVLGGDARGAAARRPEKLKARSAAGAVVLAHVREQVDQIRAQDLPARLDLPDAVHRMRVATRRLRSALTTFAPLFEAAVVRPLRGELTWLAAELGAARDAEVLRDRVAAVLAADDEAGPAAEQVLAELGRAHRAAHDRLLADLDGERYHRLLAALDELVGAPPTTDRAAGRAKEELPRLVGRSFTAVRRLVEQADAHPTGPARDELLHAARKKAKAARYAGESVERVFGDDAAAFARAMETLQEALGEHQDSVLTRQRLRELAATTPSTGAAFLYGRLHALEEARGAGHRRRLADAWKAARRTSVRRWTR